MRHILLALIFVLAALPLQAEAQTLDWELGWETETEPEILELNNDLYFSLTLEYWVDNQRPIPVEIDFSFSLSEGDFEVDIPDKTTIDGQSNESFSLEISGYGYSSEGEAFSADSVYSTFTLTAFETIANQDISQKNIDKDLQFSKYNTLWVNYEPFPSLYSGADVEGSVFVGNGGNTGDVITDVAIEIKACPQLLFEGQEEINGQIIPEGGSKRYTLKVSAPQSHPTKTCEITIKVRSEGSGLWYANNVPFTITVVAPEAGDGTNDDTSPSGQETMGNDLEINNSGILPSLTILSTLFIVGFAAIFRREKE